MVGKTLFAETDKHAVSSCSQNSKSKEKKSLIFLAVTLFRDKFWDHLT